MLEKAGERSRAATVVLEDAAAAGGVTHAGMAVLSNRALFALITGFLTGYPYAVHKFYRDFHEAFLLQQGNSPDDPQTPRRTTTEYYEFVVKGVDRIPFHLKSETVLPHLAIAANDAEMLRVLYRVSKRPQYQSDLKLSFAKVMYVAVLLNRVEMLECIAELKATDLEWEWEPSLMRVAVMRYDPEMRVLNWLDTHLPPDYFFPSTEFLERPTKRGDLGLVRWLRERKCRISRRVIDEAARLGHVHLLQYFYNSRHEGKAASDIVDAEDVVGDSQERKKREYIINSAAKHGQLEAVKFFLEGETKVETPCVIDHATGNGQLEAVKYLHETHSGGCTSQAMTNAAAFGHLDVVKFLHENRTEGYDPDTLDRAARNGHLEIVKFLHEKYALACSSATMDQIAVDGHLEVLKFLHDKRIGTCSIAAMDGAALRGHLEIVKFLHQNRSEGCTTRAMDSAAERGHLEIVEFLHFNRTEGCTANALRNTVSEDRYNVAEFLLEHRAEGDFLSALILAASLRRLEIVQLLRTKLQPGRMVAPIVEAASRQTFWTSSVVWAYLCATQQQEPVSFLNQAVAAGSFEVLVNVWKYASIGELMDAKEFALELNKPEFAQRLGTRISEVLAAQTHETSISRST